MLPAGLGARVDLGSWEVPEPFITLTAWSGLDDGELFRTFNMGIGLVVVIDEADRMRATELGHRAIGSVIRVADGDDRVVFTGSWR